jgi:threonine/homoserine/homoserine lactone efflux protein
MLAKDSSDLISFLIAVMALFLIPGPAVFLTLAQSVHGGRKVGFATALGIALGDCVHVLMAIMGLSALLVASATAFQAVKYIGVMYLLYLAVKAWRAKPAEAH